MSDYAPDRWVVLKIVNEGNTFYKVLAGWVGGYLEGDSWRLNSGVTCVTETIDTYTFSGTSGSKYVCSKHSYGTTIMTASIFNRLSERFPGQVSIMPEDTDWDKVTFNY